MEKKYIPEGCWLACNKGTSPSDFRISHNNNTNIYGVKLASEADKLPFLNIKPMGMCTVKKGMCVPAVPKWDNPQEGVTVNGYRLLKEDSTCKCVLGGTIKIYFERAAAAAACAFGALKSPSEFLKEKFDAAEKIKNANREARDSILPGWLKPLAHGKDWVDDLTEGVGKGVVNGVVGTGEAIYHVAQDPVGTGEAIGGMAKSGYNWASNGDNWKNTFNSAKNWASSADNWKNAATGAGSWILNNPGKTGEAIGEILPDAAAAVYTGGAATAAKAGVTTVAKKATKEGLEEVAEKAAARKITKEGAEEVAEKAAKENADDVVGRVVVKSIPPWKGPADYSKINKKRYKIGENKEFSQAQKDAIYEANMKHNDGLIRSDLDGTVLERPGKSMSGVTPSPNEAQIDHIFARSKGGTNDFDNAQILSRAQNRAKSDN